MDHHEIKRLSHFTYELAIVEVTEYHHEDSTCSEDIYYLCLSKRFSGVGKKPPLRNLNCSCTPFPLPVVETEIPICDDSDMKCGQEALMKLEFGDRECQKSCMVKEFEATMKRTPAEGDRRKEIRFEYKFGLPRSMRDGSFRQPFKYVKTEYFITDFMTLVGTVGGTLGMFVGFSIIGSLESVIELAGKCLILAKSLRVRTLPIRV